MSAALRECLWSKQSLPAALEAVARRAGLPPVRTAPPPPHKDDAAFFGQWLESAAPLTGLEAEATLVAYSEATNALRSLGTALVLIGNQVAVLLGARGRKAILLAPDHTERLVPIAELRDALCAKVEAEHAKDLDALLDRVGLRGAKREKARNALLRERLGGWRLQGAWILRLPPGTELSLLARARRLIPRTSGLALLYSLHFSLWLVSWWLVGVGALSGRIEPGWLAAWALLRLTLVPLQALITYGGGQVAIDAGAILKSRLLAGSLRMRPEQIRREGVGQLLGRAFEAEAVETLGTSGAFLAIFGVVELLLAAVVMAFGAAGPLQIAALACWCVLAIVLGLRFHRERARWTEMRTSLTHDQVERMVGHRTRLAQEPREKWHDEEDGALERYLSQSKRLDAAWLPFGAGIPRSWLVVGLLALGPAFVSGADPGRLALSVFGLVLAFRSLQKVGGSLTTFSGAALSFRQIAPLLAAAKPAEPLAPTLVEPDSRGDIVLEAHDLVFRHEGRAEPAVRGANLLLRSGDRVLLQGATGSGKSTFGALLCGLRVPQSGLLLLRGLDRRTLGADTWRKRVACAPQFHENHVLTGTFAFNLLMGRTWPAPSEDLREAMEICKDLGLGPLLERMPAGLQQTVGETGWQLSHGEKSRLFIARALLQRADVVTLDESFAALDPLTMRQALHSVLERAKTLVVIAHP